MVPFANAMRLFTIKNIFQGCDRAHLSCASLFFFSPLVGEGWDEGNPRIHHGDTEAMRTYFYLEDIALVMFSSPDLSSRYPQKKQSSRVPSEANRQFTIDIAR